MYCAVSLSLVLVLGMGCSNSSTNLPVEDIHSDVVADTGSDTGVDNGSDAAERDVVDLDVESDSQVGPDLAVSDTAEGDTTVPDVIAPDTTDDDAVADDTNAGDTNVSDTTESDVPAGPTLEFVIVGDPVSDVSFADSWVSQTPSNFFIGVQKVMLLTSADDAAPVTIFDVGDNDYTEVDMQGSTSLTTVDLFSVLSGTYTHAKILLATARMTVQARVHPPSPLPAVNGPVSVIAALSDTVINATARAQDWVQYSFNLGGFSFVKPGVLPVFPDSATGQVIKENGQTWLLMELSEHLVINFGLSSNYVATVTMKTKNSFRWEDQSTSGYVTNVFDSDSSGNSEPVRSFGPGEYSIVVQGL